MPAYEYTVRVVTFDPTKESAGTSPALRIDVNDMVKLGWEAMHIRWETDHCVTLWRRLKLAYLGIPPA